MVVWACGCCSVYRAIPCMLMVMSRSPMRLIRRQIQKVGDRIEGGGGGRAMEGGKI